MVVFVSIITKEYRVSRWLWREVNSLTINSHRLCVYQEIMYIT